jgi:hypothetical protein
MFQMPSPDSPRPHRRHAAILLLSAAAALGGCATAGKPVDRSWRATGLPAQFDYVCERGRRAHDRISIDLPRKVWAEKDQGPYPIARIEPYRLILEEGSRGSDVNQRVIDVATGAYFLEVNIGEPTVSVTTRGECKVGRFTYQTRRARGLR